MGTHEQVRQLPLAHLTCGWELLRLENVLITPIQLQDEPLRFDETIAVGALDFTEDLRQVTPLSVKGEADLIVEHREEGQTVDDIRVRAGYRGEFEVLCARCVEPVPMPMAGDFDVIFRPEGADADSAERAITVDETEIGYYGESGLLLEDVVREQVLLSLPGRTLCQSDCKGLCPRCGQNLNQAACSCDKAPEDPRWNALAGLADKLTH